MNLTYRHIITLAIPVVLANLAMPLQSAIDTAVVGHFSDSSKLAGMGLAIQILSILLVSFNFLQYATSGLSAQIIGSNELCQAEKNAELLAILQRASCFAFVIGFLLFITQQWLIPFALQLLSASDTSGQAATEYLDIRFYGVIAELINYAFVGWFAGQGKTKLMLFQQGFIAISNIILTLSFVYILGMGLAGVALGTVISYWLAVGLSLFLVANNLQINFSQIFNIQLAQFGLHKFRQLFALNKDIFIRTLLLTLSFAWITRLASQSGDTVLATHAILLQILAISAYALDGVAVATESLSGQSYASKNSNNFKTVIKRTGIVSYLLALILTLMWWLVMPSFISLMTDLQPIQLLAYQYRWFAILLPLIGVGAYWLDGVFFGLTAGKQIRQVAIVVAIIFFPLSWWLYQQFAISGIWLSVWAFLLLRLFILTLFLLQKLMLTSAMFD